MPRAKTTTSKKSKSASKTRKSRADVTGTSKKVSDDGEAGKTVAAAFSDAQRTTAAHPRAAKQLLLAFNQSPPGFLPHFIHALNRMLVIYSRDSPVERLIQFVAHFIASNGEAIPNFCTAIMLYLVSHSNASTPAVRFRTVQLIASILVQLPVDAELSESTMDVLQGAIFRRANDRVPRVRAAAAGALCRMQQTGDPACDESTRLLTSMIKSDGSAAVRKAALQAVAITNETIPFVLGRIRDVSPDVRKSAYEILALKVSPRDLHHDEIGVLLREGMKDRVRTVRDTCRQTLLLEGWMKRLCDGNVFEIVEILGCHDQETEVLNALKVVFESKDYSKLLDVTNIDVSSLKRDSVLVLRGLCEAKRGDGGIDRFIQSLREYANVLHYYAVDEFASKHLLELCKCVDLSDEAGRKIVEHTIRTEFLCKDEISENTIPYAVRALRRTMPDEESFVRLLIDTVSHDILTLDDDEGKEGVDVNSGEEGEDENATKKGEWQRLRSLNICLEALRGASRSSRSSAINMLYDNLLNICALPKSNLVDTDVSIKHKVIECIGLFCIQDKSGIVSRQYIPLFIEASQSNEVSIQELALKSITDILIINNFSSVASDGSDKDPFSSSGSQSLELGADKEQSTEAANKTPRGRRKSMHAGKTPKSGEESPEELCVTILARTLKSNDGESRTVAAQGLARLLFLNRMVPDPKLLACLLFVFHDPSNEDDADLRQSLSVFFPAFAAKSPTNKLALEAAFEPMCDLILEHAPPHEPHRISLAQAAQFLLDLTSTPPERQEESRETDDDVDHVGKPVDETHHRLAEFILNQIMDYWNREEEEESHEFAKILAGFSLSCTSANVDHFWHLLKLTKVAISDVTDKKSLRCLKRFSDRLYDSMNNLEEIYEDEHGGAGGEGEAEHDEAAHEGEDKEEAQAVDEDENDGETEAEGEEEGAKEVELDLDEDGENGGQSEGDEKLVAEEGRKSRGRRGRASEEVAQESAEEVRPKRGTRARTRSGRA